MRNPTFGIIVWLGRLTRLPQLSYICIVMLRLKTLTILGSRAELASLPDGKLLINTVNASTRHRRTVSLQKPFRKGMC